MTKPWVGTGCYQGVLHWLGTGRGTTHWQNPATLGAVRVSSLVWQSNKWQTIPDARECAPWRQLENVVANDTSQYKGGQVMAWDGGSRGVVHVDLKSVKVRPTHFAIRGPWSELLNIKVHGDHHGDGGNIAKEKQPPKLLAEQLSVDCSQGFCLLPILAVDSECLSSYRAFSLSVTAPAGTAVPPDYMVGCFEIFGDVYQVVY